MAKPLLSNLVLKEFNFADTEILSFDPTLEDDPFQVSHQLHQPISKIPTSVIGNSQQEVGYIY